MAGFIQHRYQEWLTLGEIEPDPAQSAATVRLDVLAGTLAQYKSKPKIGIGQWFGLQSRKPPKGLYLFGEVGRGKTMLMDLFFEEIVFAPKRRVHFHEFMSEVHDRIREARASTTADPIPRVAKDMAGEAALLCFDELHVTDIADAMILGRLFQVLFSENVVVIATSNAHPNGLYRNGLNRQLFLPFIGLLQDNMEILELKSAKDFRLDKIAGSQLYFSPPDEKAKVAIDGHWDRLTGRHPGKPANIDVKGRAVRIPLASMGVARFAFTDLCDQPLGATDYLHIAHAFHTVVIDSIPVMDKSRRDVARRFINLIDALYDNGVCLIASAEAEPHQLYPSGDGADLFTRTASRLIEMRSEAYVSNRRRASSAV